jgi:hypothetical protein
LTNSSVAGTESNSSEILSANPTKQPLIARLIDPDRVETDVPTNVQAEIDALLLQDSGKIEPCENIEATLAEIIASDSLATSRGLMLQPQGAKEGVSKSQISLEETARTHRGKEGEPNRHFLAYTEQLTLHSKRQLDRAKELTTSFEELRRQISAGLELSNSYGQLKSLIDRTKTTKSDIEAAHTTLISERQKFEVSLQQIEASPEFRGFDRSISTDKLEMSELERQISLKTKDIERHLKNAETVMRERKLRQGSTSERNRLVQLERAFVHLEKTTKEDREQFFELTADSIEKSAQLESQLKLLAHRLARNEKAIAELETSIEVVRQIVDNETIVSDSFSTSLDYKDLLADLEDLRASKRKIAHKLGRINMWLWILSFSFVTFGILFLFATVKFG